MVIEIGAGKVRDRKEDQILRRSSVGRVGKRGNSVWLGSRACILDARDRGWDEFVDD